MKTPGSCWHIVDIPGDSSGKNLEVRIIPVYEGYYGNEVSLVYGTRGDCILKILTDCLGILVISLWNPVCRCYLHNFSIVVQREEKEATRQKRKLRFF